MKTKLPLLLFTGYLCLLLAWGFSNPPGAAPDEVSHYVKALSVGRGDFNPGGVPTAADLPSFPEFLLPLTRLIEISNTYSPGQFLCDRALGQPEWECPGAGPSSAVWPTYYYSFPPFGYMLPGYLMKFGSGAVSALLWGRAGNFVPAAILLALAIYTLWDPRKRSSSLLGLTATITPMVLFVGGNLNPSSIEIAGSVCFIAAVLRLSRTDQAPTRAVWLALALGGAATILSRHLGFVWVAFTCLAALLFAGLRPYSEVLRVHRRRTLTVAATLGVSLLAVLAWDRVAPATPAVTAGEVIGHLPESWVQLYNMMLHQVGVFGALDTLLPEFVYKTWMVLILVLIGAALLLGSMRQRLTVLGAVAAALLAPLVLTTIFLLTGWGASQGRHVMALTAAVPLFAGETLYRSRHRRAARLRYLLMPVFALITALFHALAWYDNGKRRVTGFHGVILFDGPVKFWESATSGPPLGWGLWAAVATAGGLLVAIFGILSMRNPQVDRADAAIS